VSLHEGSDLSYLFRAKWRTSIYRGAEAMTVFAVMTGGLFPLIHAGRMWFAYWLLPYPNQRYLWPNFKSALVWDVFAISTYLTISVIFFIVGLVPKLFRPELRALGLLQTVLWRPPGRWCFRALAGLSRNGRIGLTTRNSPRIRS
jgi:Ni/Fe-hydrogenase subunit HybB-like protein